VHTLLTVIAGLAALLSTWLFFRASALVREAYGAIHAHERAANKLNAMAGRVVSLEGAVESLAAQHRKLSGKFYALASEYREEHEADDEQERLGYGDGNVDQRSFALTASICDNWSVAQITGPNSDAASCECSYCVGRRAERRALRSALVPKTVQGQAEVAKLNAGKP